MARRRPAEVPASDSRLPVELREGYVVVEHFVDPSEQPTAEDVRTWGAYNDPNYSAWRKLRAWRRWQNAVKEWGLSQDLDVGELRKAGLYPTRTPPFRGR